MLLAGSRVAREDQPTTARGYLGILAALATPEAADNCAYTGVPFFVAVSGAANTRAVVARAV